MPTLKDNVRANKSFCIKKTVKMKLFLMRNSPHICLDFVTEPWIRTAGLAYVCRCVQDSSSVLLQPNRDSSGPGQSFPT